MAKTPIQCIEEVAIKHGWVCDYDNLPDHVVLSKPGYEDVIITSSDVYNMLHSEEA